MIDRKDFAFQRNSNLCAAPKWLTPTVVEKTLGAAATFTIPEVYLQILHAELIAFAASDPTSESTIAIEDFVDIANAAIIKFMRPPLKVVTPVQVETAVAVKIDVQNPQPAPRSDWQSSSLTAALSAAESTPNRAAKAPPKSVAHVGLTDRPTPEAAPRKAYADPGALFITERAAIRYLRARGIFCMVMSPASALLKSYKITGSPLRYDTVQLIDYAKTHGFVAQ